MKKYRRIKDFGEYSRITTVDESGKYIQVVRWKDGMVTSHVEDNLFSMGWHSVEEFIKKRPGFVEVFA